MRKLFKKKKAATIHVKIKESGNIFVFAHYVDRFEWWFVGEFETIEDAENEMIVTGEPESVEYKVIRGMQLETYDGVAEFPTIIKAVK